MANSSGASRYYLGLSLVALTTLSIQIAITRLMSLVTWYHLAFFSITLCMLGMTAGAVRVYIKPIPELNSIALECLGFGLTAAISVLVICNVPLQLFNEDFTFSPYFIGATILLMAPFYFSGAIVAQILSQPELPAGRLYGSDLFGASFGCIVVLVAMTVIDVPSLMLMLGGVAALAGVVFDPHSKLIKLVGGVLVLAAVVNAAMPEPWLHARFSKGGRLPRASIVDVSKWNSFSHVLILKPTERMPFYWGKSPNAIDTGKIESSWMAIDGLAGTPMFRYSSNGDVAFLKYDVTNVAQFLRPFGHSAVIGVGGGRDVQSALLFGHEKVTAVEVNPIIVNAHKTRYASFAGIAGNPAVNLVIDDGRSYMARSNERFALLQMSMVDTWAATGAGAFSLSENGLYTVEGWKIFLKRLDDTGILTVSRWHNPSNLGETARLVSVAMMSLFESGVADPAAHLAMVTSGKISTLIACKSPLSEQDVATLRQVVDDYNYTMAFAPGIESSNPILRNMLSTRNSGELVRFAGTVDLPYNILPSTDDSPFFFNMLKAGSVFDGMSAVRQSGSLRNTVGGVLSGNLLAEFTLIALIAISVFLALLTAIVPLLVAKRTAELKQAGFLPSALLFSMIGLGFMFVEIGMMERLSTFLGYPIYALAILLFAIILSTGIGSFVSDRLSLQTIRKVVACIIPMLIALPYMLASIIQAMESSGLAARIAVSILFIVPFGLVMGMFFPTGLKLTRKMGFTDTAWFWALNGVFGTVASGVAVYISIHFGISTTIYCAAVCYVIAVAAMSKMSEPVRRGHFESVRTV
ncbi:MAG TPA: hypothetical protein VMJ33_08955 [Gallionella sp.]|nr:hypothetical protein [Gallionella sp.]